MPANLENASEENFGMKTNLLPFDGEACYFGKLFSEPESDQIFVALLNSIEWQPERVKLFGKEIILKRKTAWYGDSAYEYRYSGTAKTAKLWNELLLEIKHRVEKITNESYNCCLLNLYHEGDEAMGWHSDDEQTIAADSAIASVSFGASRRFLFRHKKTLEKIQIVLETGSVLLMKGQTQRNWMHSLPKTAVKTGPRINLTFRKFAS